MCLHDVHFYIVYSACMRSALSFYGVYGILMGFTPQPSMQLKDATVKMP